jgi:tetratricopeptide (TPR) repeat protein
MQRIAATLVLAATLGAQEPDRGRVVENVVTLSDPAQTYTLYLPPGYSENDRRPLLYIFDPGGRGTRATELFRDAAEEYRWIIISSNGTKSGDGPANDKALRAVLPEADRYATDARRRYASGMSAGAMLSWAVGSNTNLLAGVIGSGGRLVDNLPREKFNFAHYGFAGDTDFNHREMRLLDAELARHGKAAHRFETFEGDHRWMPPALAKNAVGWMELVAMKENRRVRDQALVDRLYANDLSAAAALESKGKRVEALDRYKAIVRTFDGLRPFEEARDGVARLERDPATKAEAKELMRWYAFEDRYLSEVVARMNVTFAALREEPAGGILGREVRLPELKSRAKRPDPEGLTARRLLATLYSQLSFVFVPALLERREPAIAVEAMRVAVEIRPDLWQAHYNLGAIAARAGMKKRALDSLEKAIELGMKDAALLAGDADFASVRDDERFRELAGRIAKP